MKTPIKILFAAILMIASFNASAQKLSALPLLDHADIDTATDIMAIVHSGVTYKTTPGNLLHWSPAGGGGGGSFPDQQVLFGTGSGISSNSKFTYDHTLDLLDVNDTNGTNLFQIYPLGSQLRCSNFDGSYRSGIVFAQNGGSSCYANMMSQSPTGGGNVTISSVGNGSFTFGVEGYGINFNTDTSNIHLGAKYLQLYGINTQTTPLQLRFCESYSNGTTAPNYIGFVAPTSITGNTIWTLPGADGSANQFLKTNGSGTLSWATPSLPGDAAADAATKGIATFAPNDFNSSSGLISFDYTNAQKADASHNGIVTSTDWSTFNGKASVAGSTGELQFNNSGALAASSHLTWDNSTGDLHLQDVSGNETFNIEPSTGDYEIGNISSLYGAKMYISDGGNYVDLTSAATELLPYGASAGNTQMIKFLELLAGGTNYVAFKAPDAITQDNIYILPDDDGSINQGLATDGSDNLHWQTFAVPTGATGELQFMSSGNLASSGSLVWDDGNAQLTLADGSISKPSYSFISKPTFGMFVDGAGSLAFNSDAGGMNLESTGIIYIGDHACVGNCNELKLDDALSTFEITAAGGGFLNGSLIVNGVVGTSNRITSTGGGNPVIDISSSYVGQSSITTLGTITSGTWSGTTIAVNKGGTGITSFGTGIATWLGTPSSANLASAITDETGSGLAVFATNPVLTTPNIGTPSAGTLTSCTGLPISTGVSGLGTGVATFLATPSSANFMSAITDEVNPTSGKVAGYVETKDADLTSTATITWTQTGSAPTGPTARYSWTQVGNMVNCIMRLEYSGAGANCTAVNVTLPSDMPAPAAMTGQGASELFMAVSGNLATSPTGTPVAARAWAEYTAGSAIQFKVLAASGAYQMAMISFTYFK